MKLSKAEKEMLKEIIMMKWEDVERLMHSLLCSYLSKQKGNLAVVWAGKLLRRSGLPLAPALLFRLTYYLKSVDRVEVDGVVWVKSKFKPNHDPQRRCVVFQREGRDPIM
ncbi:MAG: hypothetical protein QXJ59_01755 [Thermofilaceae archaeon]